MPNKKRKRRHTQNRYRSSDSERKKIDDKQIQLEVYL